ncbi:DUF4184 family protein [Angustibacter luteus]|uniref:DUF4184 family protein n=1 Tax=Angustibacter luteus TaxID=658456 RepID=A0ABW1JAT3_9ACTN
MPFTVSHVVAVLPLRRVPWLPTSALVIGSMAPDSPSMVGALRWRDSTHTLAGAMTTDVAITAVGCVLWAWVLRPVVADLVPALAARWRPSVQPRRPLVVQGLLWYLAAAIGCLTHVVWDAFTHPGGAEGGWIPLDGVNAHTYAQLQLLSSVLGIVILAWWTARWWRAHPPIAHSEPGTPAVRHRRSAVALVVVAAGALWAATDRALTGGRAGQQVLVDLGFGALAGALVGALLVAVVYRLTLLRGRST